MSQPAAEGRVFTVYVCSECGVQLVGGGTDDLGHPGAYVSDCPAMVRWREDKATEPAFEEIEIEVVPRADHD